MMLDILDDDHDVDNDGISDLVVERLVTLDDDEDDIPERTNIYPDVCLR